MGDRHVCCVLHSTRLLIALCLISPHTQILASTLQSTTWRALLTALCLQSVICILKKFSEALSAYFQGVSPFPLPLKAKVLSLRKDRILPLPYLLLSHNYGEQDYIVTGTGRFKEYAHLRGRGGLTQGLHIPHTGKRILVLFCFVSTRKLRFLVTGTLAKKEKGNKKVLTPQLGTKQDCNSSTGNKR